MARATVIHEYDYNANDCDYYEYERLVLEGDNQRIRHAQACHNYETVRTERTRLHHYDNDFDKHLWDNGLVGRGASEKAKQAEWERMNG